MVTLPNSDLVCLDNEGGLTRNDNAYEATVALAKKLEKKDPEFWFKVASEITIFSKPEEQSMTLGEIIAARFYHFLSNIDDIWGDFHRIGKDPTYSSGHTLKVILPFYRAMEATFHWSYEFADKSLLVVPNVKETLAELSREYETWQVSTSYEWFIKAFCDRVGFDFAKAYCTKVPKFDEIGISQKEQWKLLRFMKEVAQWSIIKYDSRTGNVFPEHQSNYKTFTDFIWETVWNMGVGEFLRIVRPIGQAQKREAVEEICRLTGIPREKTMYMGDSQTDVEVVKWLRGKGLTMMFNGKGPVFGFSDIAYIGEDARTIAWVANHFAQDGRELTLAGISGIYKLSGGKPNSAGDIIAVITPENRETLEKLSAAKRKEFRGVQIGGLS